MTHRAAAARTAVLALALLPGCLTSSQATRLQKDLDDVKKQIFQLQQDSTATRARIEEMAAAAGAAAAPEGEAGLRADIRALVDQSRVLSERIVQIDGRVAALAQHVSSPGEGGRRAAGGIPPAAPAAPSPGGAADLETAYADYSKGNYDLALAGFAQFLQAHPGDPAAQDAQYWIGECLFSQRKYIEAAEAFGRAADGWPAGGRTPAALLKKGLAQIEAGQASQGILTLQKLIGAHPQADEAGVAAERLRQLGLRSPQDGRSG